jgi:hypothetical protein
VSAAAGEAIVERGVHPLAGPIANLIGFPKQGSSALRVEFRADSRGEIWRRSFGRQSFESVQYAGRGRSDALLCERFGPLEFAMALVLDGSVLRLVLRRWSVLGLALPLWLAPRSVAFEHEQDGKFHFHVEIGHPLVGLIVRYRGFLRPLELGVAA